MPNYNNSKIYKIINTVNDDLYVGSTVQKLSMRFAEHRRSIRRYPNIKLYKEMAELGIEHFKIILLEPFACNSKEELIAREQYHTDLLKPSLNSNKACTNLDKDEYSRNYYIENRDKIRARKKITDKAYREAKN